MQHTIEFGRKKVSAAVSVAWSVRGQLPHAADGLRDPSQFMFVRAIAQSDTAPILSFSVSAGRVSVARKPESMHARRHFLLHSHTFVQTYSFSVCALVITSLLLIAGQREFLVGTKWPTPPLCHELVMFNVGQGQCSPNRKCFNLNCTGMP